jgi:phosphoribosylformimino-5-aminoimidazole carboxamide ribonucleotide (ProFAR) isomerase
MQNDIIANMTNLGDSGQDEFVSNWAEYAKLTLYEKGVSKKFINSVEAAYILAKIVTDIVDDGTLSKAAESMIATLRINHPHSEDL